MNSSLAISDFSAARMLPEKVKKEKRLSQIETFIKRAAPIALALIMVAPLLFSVAFADDNSGTILKEALKLIGKLAVVLGIVFLAIGIVHYAQANSDGDGPAKMKAGAQIASGVMLGVVGILLNQEALLNTFTGMMLK